MKAQVNLRFLFAFLFLFSTVNITTSFAQDSPQWDLPDGARARLGKGTIRDIAYSPDGTRLAVGGSLGIWIYDADTGAEVALIGGHTGNVSSIAFSPDGNTIATGGYLGVGLWDVATGTLTNTLQHTSEVNSVSFSPDGSTIATGSGGLHWKLGLHRTIMGRSNWNSQKTHSQNTLTGSLVSHSVPMEIRSQVEVGTAPCGYGMWQPAPSQTHSRDTPSGSIVFLLVPMETLSQVEVRIVPCDCGMWQPAPSQTRFNTPTGSIVSLLVPMAIHSQVGVRMAPMAPWVYGMWQLELSETRFNTPVRSFSLLVCLLIRMATLSQVEIGPPCGYGMWQPAPSQTHSRDTPAGSIVFSFSPDGNTIASGSQDGTVRLWDVATGTLTNTLTGHTPQGHECFF